MNQITKEHVLQAIQEIDKEGPRAGRHSSTYDLEYKGKLYPPKLIISIANRFATGVELKPEEFQGGPNKPAFSILEKYGFKIIPKKDKITELISSYKKHIKVTQLKDEKYKWELLSKYKGRPNLETENLFEELKSINYDNLIFKHGKAVLYHLVNERPNEVRMLFLNLYNDELQLTERIKSFNLQSLELYRSIGQKLQHHQDERTIGAYLTFHNPEKYTFYKYSFYKKMCEMLNEKEAKKNEKYEHYILLVNKIIEDYIQEDAELISLVKSYVPEYDGSNHLLLTQDILYQMLDKKGTTNEVNVKEEFIDWMAANIGGGNYYEKQFGSNRERFDKELTSYEAVYKSEFEDELFTIDFINLENEIGILKNNIYSKDNLFYEFSKKTATDRPKAILGKNNYLRFLNEYFSKQETMENLPQTHSFPLNQILYGPPGTGKTYNTVLEAAKIVTVNEKISYEEALKVFNDNLHNQIEFITFHQNYSYEDFIQGLRPDTENNGVLTFEKKRWYL